MDIALGSLRQIAQVVLAIKAAADAAQQNKQDCGRIAARVSRLGTVLSWLESTEMARHPSIIGMLSELERTLRQALELVTACQEKNRIFSQYFNAKKMSKQLRQANEEISERMMDAVFATNAQVTITLVAHFQGVPAHQQPQDEFINYFEEIVTDQGNRDAAAPSYLTKFRFSEMEAATNNFSEQNLIGEDSLASVYKGVLPNGLEVVIKRLHGQCNLVFPVRLQHENVVRYLGYCLNDMQELVVEEYMPNGTLSEIIKGSLRQLDWPSTFRIILGIAQGVAYLQTMCVVHSDLKPDTILFDLDMNPKIYGFERSRLLLEQGVTKIVTEELLGTVGNMPPEYIADGIISMKSDVFSFGVLLLRTISGMRDPIHNQHPIGWAWELREARRMRELFDPSSCDESQLKEIERCIDIALLCTQMDPADRPTMLDVLKMLNGEEKLPTPERPGFVKNKNYRASKEEEEEKQDEEVV